MREGAFLCIAGHTDCTHVCTDSQSCAKQQALDCVIPPLAAGESLRNLGNTFLRDSVVEKSLQNDISHVI